MNSFHGQVVVVTGAGRGIGRAYALLFGELDAAVMVNDVWTSPEVGPRARVVADEIIAAGGRAAWSTHDVSTAAGGRALVEQSLSQWGRIDALVHNAGRTIRTALEQTNGAQGGLVRFVDADVDVLQRHLAVDVLAAHYLCQAAWPGMAARGDGRIVLTSSPSIFGYDGLGSYALSKMALISLVRTIDLEAQAAGLDIRCNAIAPMAATDERSPAADRLGSRGDPANVAPVAALLASRDCPLRGECLVAGLGHISRVIVGLTQGWTGGPGITIEDVEANLAQACAPADLTIPADAHEVLAGIHGRFADA